MPRVEGLLPWRDLIRRGHHLGTVDFYWRKRAFPFRPRNSAQGGLNILDGLFTFGFRWHACVLLKRETRCSERRVCAETQGGLAFDRYLHTMCDALSVG